MEGSAVRVEPYAQRSPDTTVENRLFLTPDNTRLSGVDSFLANNRSTSIDLPEF